MDIHQTTYQLIDESAIALTIEEQNEWIKQLPRWQLIDQHTEAKLQACFDFKNFADALAFTQHIGTLAETVNHHPTLVTEWGKVTVIWWTHSLNGLHLNDFVMAAQSEKYYPLKNDHIGES